MEFLAKITKREKRKLFWEYTFINTQTDEKGWFLSTKRLNCIFNYVGKLILSVNDDGIKSYVSFKQDISNLSEELEEAFFNFKERPQKRIKNVESDDAIKKTKIKLSPCQLREWKQKKIRGKTLKQKEIAGITGYTDRMVRYWETNADKPKQKRGVKPKMTKKILILLHFYLNDNPKSFQRKTVEYLHKATGILFHRSTISRAIKEIEFSRKKIPYRYLKQKEQMPHFWKFVKRIQSWLETPYLLAFDESGIPLNMAPTWGYAPIGERVEDYKPGWGENCSLLLLIQNIGNKGVIHWKVVEGTVDSLVFHNFLREVMLPTNDEYCLLMDNVSFHKKVGKYKVYNEKDPSFRDFPIEYRETSLPPAPEYLTSRNIKVEFITPNFPQLNPVEELNNVIKAYVREQEPRTKEELEKVIAKKVNILQQEDMSKFFKDCLDYDDILKNLDKKEEI